MDMKPSTIRLHQILIRLGKGMLSAWEAWLRDQQLPTKVEKDPDPVEHFRNLR
jgi:hypothetical protein